VLKDLNLKVKLQQVFVPKENVLPKAPPNLPTKITEIKPYFSKQE
jgi:hypothetical protein